jgi:toxin HigB-1
MIKSFKCKETEKIFKAKISKKLPADIQKRALIKLHSINIATEFIDLTMPPSNKLEGLKGDRKGQNSIRINDQWRICFKWVDNNAFDVEIVDYH